MTLSINTLQKSPAILADKEINPPKKLIEAYRGLQILSRFAENPKEINQAVRYLHWRWNLQEESYLSLCKTNQLSQQELEAYKIIWLAAVVNPREYRVIMSPASIQKKLDKQRLRANAHRLQQTESELQYIRYQQPDRNYTNFKSGVKILNNCEIGIAQIQGPRTTQEDTFLTQSFSFMTPDGKIHTISIIGIFDGHSGVGAARYMMIHLSKKIQNIWNNIFNKTFPSTAPLKLLENEVTLTKRVITNTLKIACVELSHEYKQIDNIAGTTASFSLLINGDDLWHANVGDSRAFVVAEKNEPIQLSTDMHLTFNFPRNLSKKEFKAIRCSDNFLEKRVWKRGGFVSNTSINGLLVPAGSIGDGKIGPGVSARPSIVNIRLSKEFPDRNFAYLVLASDGLWDITTTNHVAQCVLQSSDLAPQKIAKNITISADASSPFDNTTTIVAKIHLYRES